MSPAPLPLQASRLAQYALAALLLAALLTALAVASPWGWGMLLLTALGSGWSLWRQPRVRELRSLADGRLMLTWRDGRQQEVELLPSSRCLSWLLVLHLRHAGGRLELLVWPDSAPAELRRQWRIWLRWCAGQHKAVSTGGAD